MLGIGRRSILSCVRSYSQKTPITRPDNTQIGFSQSSRGRNIGTNLTGAVGGALTAWSGICMYTGKQSDSWRGRTTGVVDSCQAYVWGSGLALRIKYKFQDSAGNEYVGSRIRAGSPFRGIEPLYWWAGESIKSFAVEKKVTVKYDEHDPSRCGVIPGMALIQNIPAFLTGVSLLLFFGFAKKGGLLLNTAKYQPPRQR